MNKDRKKKLVSIMNELETLYARLDDIRGLEDDAMMNVPESLQETDRYEEMEEAFDNLDNACSSLEDALDSIKEVI